MTDPSSPTGPDQPVAGEASRTSSLQIGSILAGRYRILGSLGDGAMGSVYLGEHLRIGRKDAIKVLRDSLANDKEAMARFVRGARSVSRIRHENVCTIYDFSDTSEGVQFLAMEYIPGTTLRELLAQQGTLPMERVLSITLQVAGALQAAHDAGIVHRDLKPANIMLMPGKDGSDIVKVVDFDIAKAEDDTTETEVTRFGFVVGTPEYMSPEQLTGERLDGRSDIYSLALVVYRMLTGLLPFPVENTREMLVGRLTKTPLSLEETLPGRNYPRGLQQVLDWALQRNPDQRAPSCAAFAKAFRDAAVAAGVAPPATRSIASSTPAKSPAHKHAVDVPATRVADVTAGVSEGQRGGLARDQRGQAGNRKLMYGAIAGVLILATGLGAWALSNLGTTDSADPRDGIQTQGDSSVAPLPGPTGPLAGTDSGTTQKPVDPTVLLSRAIDGRTGGAGSQATGAGTAPTGTDPPRDRPATTPNGEVDSLAITRQSNALSEIASALSKGTLPEPSRLEAIRDTSLEGFRQATLPRQKMSAAFSAASALHHLKQFDDGLTWALRARDLCVDNPGLATNCQRYEVLVSIFQNRVP